MNPLLPPALPLLLLLSAGGLRGAVLVNSQLEFSGVQGASALSCGYRNFTATGTAIHYDPEAHFIPFAGGTGMGAWNAATQHWTGSAWDLNTASAAPWTRLAALSGHPAGTNHTGTFNGQPLNQEHWTIRRWRPDLSGVTPVALHCWHSKPAGSGTTVLLAINGRVVDVSTRNGSSGTRIFYANLAPRDIVDLCLSPQGTTGSRDDTADTTDFRLTADDTVSPFAMQPDGGFFAAANGPDTDGDGLNDDWEQHFFPGDLKEIDASTNHDDDGLNDAEEMAFGSHPLDKDSDGDGLDDKGELLTGTHPWRSDTDGDSLGDYAELAATPATDPLRWDTDGDSFSDAEEQEFLSNPAAAADTPLTFVIADSAAEASGVQGQHNWFYGYRNFTTMGQTGNYHPQNHFIPFTGGSSIATAWNGTTQQWSTGNSAWELTFPNTDGSSPWTSIGNDTWTHPSGPNQYHAVMNEHWAIRRWVNELTVPSAVAIIWHLRKANTNPLGTGVTGWIHINGIARDALLIGATDSTGQTRRIYANLNPGDIVDLVLTPAGLGSDRKDEADGSYQWMRIDRRIPPGPLPGGFVPVTPPGFNDIRYVSSDPVTGDATVSWGSYPNSRYRVQTSTTMAPGSWLTAALPIATGFTSAYTIPGAGRSRLFVRVLKD